MINIQHLKYAVEVERVGSFTTAAENLFISQPSLSKAIREMESSLGFAVFERTPRGVLPTQKGRALINHAYAIMKQLSEIEALSSYDEARRQTLSLSFPRADYVSEALVRFCAALDAQKPLSIRLREADSLDTIDGVFEGRYALGIIRYQLEEEALYADCLQRKKLKSEAIWEFERALLVSAASPLAARAALSEAELGDFVELKGAPARSPFMSEAARVDEMETRSLTAGGRALQYELLASLPRAYMWASPLPEATAARHGLAQRFVDRGGARLRDSMIYAADYRFTAADRAFIARLFEVKNELAFAER